MSIFGSIMNKIFHHPAAAPAQTSAPQVTDPSTAPAAPQMAGAAPASPTAPVAAVDVGAVLSDMAAQKGGGGNYQTSIVDLLHLLGLESSLNARKELAEELGVHVGEPGSAEQNIALHKAVVAKLAENGGKVPESMMH